MVEFARIAAFVSLSARATCGEGIGEQALGGNTVGAGASALTGGNLVQGAAIGAGANLVACQTNLADCD